MTERAKLDIKTTAVTEKPRKTLGLYMLLSSGFRIVPHEIA